MAKRAKQKRPEHREGPGGELGRETGPGKGEAITGQGEALTGQGEALTGKGEAIRGPRGGSGAGWGWGRGSAT